MLLQRWDSVIMTSYATPPIAFVSGDGAVLTDVDGKTCIGDSLWVSSDSRLENRGPRTNL